MQNEARQIFANKQYHAGHTRKLNGLVERFWLIATRVEIFFQSLISATTASGFPDFIFFWFTRDNTVEGVILK